ncbi:MAG TPA: alpha/beta fold hydrolase [Burkholderiales bacterium]|nr:alpha/beta fold hydrolase [Burkholderiales bacterium]
MELTLCAADGYRLGATTFGTGERAVLVMPATGVPQSYYAKFAAYLAERGFGVLTFDYRGIGRSLSGHVRDVRARMQDWALLDAAAALSFLGAKRICVVGHSFGGQALGLLPDPTRITAALFVGSQSGYWKNWPLLGRAWMWPATHVGLPLVSKLHGYFPASRLGFGEDLPAGVALQWASWCRHPRYLVGALGVEDAYSKLELPIRAYAITDDAFAPPSAVEALRRLYPNARWETRRVAPRDVGAKSLGHFGFFRERFRDSLWREAADWLEAQ